MLCSLYSVVMLQCPPLSSINLFSCSKFLWLMLYHTAKPGPRKIVFYVKQPVWAAGVLAYELAGHPSPFSDLNVGPLDFESTI